jgi:hypothetical protein
MRNEGLVKRVRAQLQRRTPYLLNIDDTRINENIELAKEELGSRQKSKHDKWTKRIVDYAVEKLREGPRV